MQIGKSSLFAGLVLVMAGCANEGASGADDSLEQAKNQAAVDCNTDGGSEEPEEPEADAGEPEEPEEPETDGGVVTPPTGDAPILPEIKGTCPTFKTGTATIGGLAGISLQVGAKKNGTGPLIFYWHGTGSFAGESNIMIPAAARNEVLAQGGIIVSPQRSTGRGGDCSGTATFSKADFEVADLIAACAVRDHNIDPRRIYTTGCSAGGLQAGCMATLRSNYIAAAAPNSGGIVFPQQFQNPQRVPAILTMHGGAADWVIVSFSQTSATIDNQFARAGGEVVNCNHGGGHCGAPGALYNAAFRFFADHPYGAKPYAAGLPSGYPNYCKKFAAAGR